MAKKIEDRGILRKTFKYRAYPNKGTTRRLKKAMKFAATPVWNACVAEREAAREQYRALLDEAFRDFVYQARRDLTEKEEKIIRREVSGRIKWPTAYDQYKHVRKRDHPEYAGYHAKMLECVIAKVDSSEKSFRALWLKGNEEARPPRQTRFHGCLTFRCSGCSPWKPERGRVHLSKIGFLNFCLHRPIEGRVKTVSVTRENGKWYISFSCEIENFPGRVAPCPKPSSCENTACGKSTAPSGGSGPDSGGAHNFVGFQQNGLFGGSGPDSGGAHNIPHGLYVTVGGGSDPDSGGAHNQEVFAHHADRGGSGPDSGGAHNAGHSGGVSFAGGSGPDSGGANNYRPRCPLHASGGSDPDSGGAHNQRTYAEKVTHGMNESNLGGEVTIRFLPDSFLVDSEGRRIDHPEFYFRSLERLAALNQRLSHKVDVAVEKKEAELGRHLDQQERDRFRSRYRSENWYKARRTLRKHHEHVKHQRDYFLWAVVHHYASQYRSITVLQRCWKYKIEYACIEDEAIRLCDGAYGRFVAMLKHKCNEFGTKLIERKDEQWQREKEQLTEQMKAEGLAKLLRRAHQAIRQGSLRHLRSLKTACERLTTQQICSGRL